MIQKQLISEKERFDALYKTLFIKDTMIFAGTLLQRAAQKWPHRIALLCKDKSITYKELFGRSCVVTQKLKAEGIGPQDKVFLWYENSIEFFIAYYGIWQTGAVIAALNVFLHEKEFDYILHDAEPKAVIISNTLLEKLSTDIRSKLPLFLDSQFIDTTINYDEQSFCEAAQKNSEELATLLYTSGTTGMPKGVMLSSKNILTNVIQVLARIDVTYKDRLYMPVPLFHSLAQNTAVWGTFFLGASAIIIPKIERRYLLQGLEQKPTILLAVPALYGIFCMIRTLKFDSVRYIVSGGDALPDKIRTAFSLIYCRKICNGYGLTETSPLISVHVTEEYVSADTVGIPVSQLACSIRDEVDNELVQGQIGILWVKGDNIMLGYYKTSDATNNVIKDGWFNTGDLAYIDRHARLHIVGRQKDMIINKGLKIYPQEVENVLLFYPAVIQAAVIGVVDGGYDQIVIAFVTIKEEIVEIEKELKKHCEHYLANYKIPRKFIVKKSLPMTSLAKINKKALKAEYEQERGQKN